MIMMFGTVMLVTAIRWIVLAPFAGGHVLDPFGLLHAQMTVGLAAEVIWESLSSLFPPSICAPGNA